LSSTNYQRVVFIFFKKKLKKLKIKNEKRATGEGGRVLRDAPSTLWTRAGWQAGLHIEVEVGLRATPCDGWGWPVSPLPLPSFFLILFLFFEF
jgi:hypothetical protein